MASIISNATHITSATTTNITPAVIFSQVNINTTGAGTITVNDGVAGTTICVITTAASTPPVMLVYDVELKSGTLSVITSATMDITILWE